MTARRRTDDDRLATQADALAAIDALPPLTLDPADVAALGVIRAARSAVRRLPAVAAARALVRESADRSRTGILLANATGRLTARTVYAANAADPDPVDDDLEDDPTF